MKKGEITNKQQKEIKATKQVGNIIRDLFII